MYSRSSTATSEPTPILPLHTDPGDDFSDVVYDALARYYRHASVDPISFGSMAATSARSHHNLSFTDVETSTTQHRRVRNSSLNAGSAGSIERNSLVRITVFRILNTVVATGYCIAKALSASWDNPFRMTGSESILVILFVVGSYMLAQYQMRHPTIWPAFFEKDLTASSLVYSSRYLRASQTLFSQGVCVPSLSLAIKFLPIRYMYRGIQEEGLGRMLWIPIAVWFALCTYLPQMPLVSLMRIAGQLGHIVPSSARTSCKRLQQQLVRFTPRPVSVFSSGIPIFDAVDLAAAATIVMAVHLVRARYGKQWWNSVQEVEHPAHLLAVDLVRRQTRPEIRGRLGYLLVWTVVGVDWVLTEIGLGA
ncbi:hypothetical protein EIP91_006827 [Steccherinum ochraceum]|uniref:Uncharacterized protein n=1 Tax=Steccherinum ochraceum TaxID=92696 RepID=A0A4R0RDG3_9APHY|nr:hypothetical protein EIP91_006827 [Steccherinum ochraceum]